MATFEWDCRSNQFLFFIILQNKMPTLQPEPKKLSLFCKKVSISKQFCQSFLRAKTRKRHLLGWALQVHSNKYLQHIRTKNTVKPNTEVKDSHEVCEKPESLILRVPQISDTDFSGLLEMTHHHQKHRASKEAFEPPSFAIRQNSFQFLLPQHTFKQPIFVKLASRNYFQLKCFKRKTYQFHMIKNTKFLPDRFLSRNKIQTKLEAIGFNLNQIESPFEMYNLQLEDFNHFNENPHQTASPFKIST